MAHGTSELDRLRRGDAAWDAFVSATPLGFYTQLTAWAKVKAANGWTAERVVVDGGSGPIGAQILLRRLGPGPFALGYAPRGPVATTWDAASLEAFAVAVRRLARRRRLTHVTVDPPLEDDERAQLLQTAGWKPTDDIQPRRAREVPLAGGEEALWTDLRSKWRQYVQKARRAGIVVTEGDRADLDTFCEILGETAVRVGFPLRSLETYQGVWDAYQGSGTELLFARLPTGTPVATLFLLRCGDRVLEPYGGMTADGAASRANYLLKWEAIRRAAAAGADVYDMQGVTYSGMEQFKAGFGGREVDYIGAFDLVTLPLLRDGIVHGRRLYLRLLRRGRVGRSEREPRVDSGRTEEAVPSIAE